MSQLSLKQMASSFFPYEVEGVEDLMELALDLRWSWNHCADEVWEKLDPYLWEVTQNPWIVLRTVSREKLNQMLANAEFRKLVKDLINDRQVEIQSRAWFQNTHPESNKIKIAYFSMEFMLSEALRIYSGGLGNVAGDQLKAASDLGVPVTAIGLLYQQGYFRQVIDRNGWQQAFFPYNDPGQLPIAPVRKSNGEWLRLEIVLPGYSLWVRTWQVTVGRVKLFLLDANDAANFPPYRGITSELYGGGSELRLQQEMLLGIAGWRLLEALNLKPDVCHLNEGHAAFAILERARSFMQETGQPFNVALAATKAGNLFTTHTAVSAGFDRFSPQLMAQYLKYYSESELGIPLNDLLALGRQNPNDSNEPFNMAYLAIRGSGAVNAVSRLHRDVSQKLFSPLFPRWPINEVPIGYVTNGIHTPSWHSTASDSLWSDTCGEERWLGDIDNMEDQIRKVSDAKLWKMRSAGRNELVEYLRKRLCRQLAVRGAPQNEIDEARHIFDPNVLTLGFARRFATYKRPNLLLHDPERFVRLLTNPQRPVQLVIAGKAHPADRPGQEMIHQWMEFIKRPEVRPHVIFISDYDMHVSEELVGGVDVWVNTPRRPWEACGTSGMKVLVNGGLNLSELDGWWAEAYTPEVGWALGDGKEHGDDPNNDVAEALRLYEILETQVVPEFYTRNGDNIPTGWVKKVRESMAVLTPQYSANRAVREYTEKYYLPAAQHYRERTSDKAKFGKQMVDWQHDLESKWSELRFQNLQVKNDGKRYTFEVQIDFGKLNPEEVRIELYAEGVNGTKPVSQAMERTGSTFRASVPADRPAENFTTRIVPHLENAEVPLEAAQILWQH